MTATSYDAKRSGNRWFALPCREVSGAGRCLEHGLHQSLGIRP